MGIDNSMLDKVFAEDGIIKSLKPTYSPRESQIEAAKKVNEALNEKKNIIIEGPCGFGKTFAYLSPIFDFVNQQIEIGNKNGRTIDPPKALVVTNGISLQEQLTKIDAPFVSNVFKIAYPDHLPIKTAIFKGRQNFLCKRKIQMFFSQAVSSIIDAEKSKEFSEWVGDTHTGDLSELSFIPDLDTQSYCVCSNPEDCEGSHCPCSGECFYNMHKIQAMDADVVVCNYHILFTGLTVPILPKFNILVMDEAHEAPNILRDFLKTDLNFNVENKLSKDLSGIFSSDVMSEWVEELSESRRNEIFCGEVKDYKNPTKELLQRIFVATEAYMSDVVKHTQFNMMANYPETYVCDKAFEFADPTNLTTSFKLLLTAVETAKGYASYIMDDSVDDDLKTEAAKLLRSFDSVTTRIRSFIDLIRTDNLDDNVVYYVEKKITASKAALISIGSKPITVGKYMSEALFSNKAINTSIITSATLSVNNSFDYIKSELGLDLEMEETERCKSKPLTEFIGSSPFNLKNQELWYLPPYAVDGNSKDFDAYLAECAREITTNVGGGILFLTTSVKLMNLCYDTVVGTCLQNNIKSNVLKQGQMPRLKLLKAFREDEDSILVATKSFFTGVDIPGNSLRCLVIDKFPFASPDDPIMKKLTAQPGGFFKFAIPSMVILLKQAVGRGVRSIDDKCIICVADGRMATARYRASVHKSFTYEKTATRNIEDVRKFLNA